MTERKGIIYCVTNKINGKKYIGLTSTQLCNRKAKHIYDARRGDGLYFHRAIIKYGEDNFIWQILEKDVEIDDLCKREVEYIQKYDTFNNGYNLTKGGEGLFGVKRSNETKIKIKKALTGKKRTKEQIENWKSSRIKNPLTKEQRDRMSIAQKGKIIKDETRIKLSNSLKGRMFSNEHKKKLSEKAKLRKITDEQREKISYTRKNMDIFKYEYKGEVKTISQYAEERGIRSNLIHQRISVLGWSIEKAIETPVAKCGRKPKQ